MRFFVYVAALTIALPACADSLDKKWSAEVGTGFSGVAVDGGRVYTLGNDGTNDSVVALDADTGAPVWKHAYPAALNANSYEGGPNATPTVSAGRVYTLGKQGRMLCLDAATGAVTWDRSPAGAEPPTWGFSSAPAVIGDAVIYNVGSRGYALHKDTGAPLWGSSGSGAGYANALPYKNDTAAVLFTSAALQALDVQTGQPLWSFDWNTSFDVNAATPTPVGNGFFISTGYGAGCALVDVAGTQVREVWRNKSLCSHFTTAVFKDGWIYGVDGNTGRRCFLVCMSATDGRVAWKQELGFATLCMDDDKLYVLNESGMLHVVKATSDQYTEIAHHRAATGKCWTAPVVANKRLYVRNAAGALTCYGLEGGALTAEPLPPDREINLGY